MPSLMDKLRMIDAEAARSRTQAADNPPSGEDGAARPTETPETATAKASANSESAEVGFYRCSGRFPLTSFSEFRHMTAQTLSEIFGIDFPRNIRPTDLLFLDTETTGLSGGVGTVAFEVGVGYLTADAFVVEQFLMRDYPEESAMLMEVARLLRAFPAIVTFNGKTFDIPLLQNRFVMNRLRDARVSELHADVLHAARRVWKLRLGRCTLQKLENAVLGVAREDDLPGEQVPQTYFQFLRDKDFVPIQRILEHNRQDVVSLAQLFFFLCKLYDRPETTAEPDDLFALARAMEKRGATDKAKKCYRMAARNAGHHTAAYTALAVQEKRSGQVQRAVKLYTALLLNGDDPVSACEGLAKLYEHQLRDSQQALVYTRQALLILSEPSLLGSEAVQDRRNALQYRYARLQRKIAGEAKP